MLYIYMHSQQNIHRFNDIKMYESVAVSRTVFQKEFPPSWSCPGTTGPRVIQPVVIPIRCWLASGHEKQHAPHIGIQPLGGKMWQGRTCSVSDVSGISGCQLLGHCWDIGMGTRELVFWRVPAAKAVLDTSRSLLHIMIIMARSKCKNMWSLGQCNGWKHSKKWREGPLLWVQSRCASLSFHILPWRERKAHNSS